MPRATRSTQRSSSAKDLGNHLLAWRDETSRRWPLLHDWASANQKLDPYALETQLKFQSEDLRGALHGVGSAVLAANTEEEATKAFKPYADRLAA